jgi:hypothetical protein
MQRPEAKNQPRDHYCRQRLRTVENRRQDPRGNGLFTIDNGFRGSGRLDGGDDLDQTGCSPRSDRTSLRNSGQERNFLLQRLSGEMASFASIAGAETALTREISRHVFEIAALSRVSPTLYNYRVWVVEVIGIEPATSPDRIGGWRDRPCINAIASGVKNGAGRCC